jgi:hypothetical protein
MKIDFMANSMVLIWYRKILVGAFTNLVKLN